jgi:hypothetical protein
MAPLSQAVTTVRVIAHSPGNATAVTEPTRYPVLLQPVLDATDHRSLAEFYRQLLGYRYRPGDEDPSRDDHDFLVLLDDGGTRRLAVQQVPSLQPSTWPEDRVPQQLHLDLVVGSVDELDAQHDRALALGARLLLDRADDEDEPLRVYADPAGHPFCIFVSALAAG